MNTLREEHVHWLAWLALLVLAVAAAVSAGWSSVASGNAWVLLLAAPCECLFAYTLVVRRPWKEESQSPTE